MNLRHPKNGRDYAGIAVVVLAIAVGVVLVIVSLSILFFDRSLSDAGGRLLGPLIAGVIGALSVYIGASRRHKGDDP